MLIGFPRAILSFIQCAKDGGPLFVERVVLGDDQSILHGTARCKGCETSYEIREGILDMLSKERLENKTSQFELEIRDREAEKTTKQMEITQAIGNEMEVPSTLRRLGNSTKISGCDLLELGCGTGRYTRLLAKRLRFVLAVDFSAQSLIVNSRTLENTKNVGLVRADVSQLRLQPGVFDLALSTCYSNLPTLEMRMSSTRAAFEGLKSGGRYLLSAHHHSPLEIIKRIPASGKYDNEIFYQCFTPRSLKKELRNYFAKIETTTICIWIPCVSRIEIARVIASKVAERIPLLNSLGAILLATAIKN